MSQFKALFHVPSQMDSVRGAESLILQYANQMDQSCPSWHQATKL